jgi:hypothetical protein
LPFSDTAYGNAAFHTAGNGGASSVVNWEKVLRGNAWGPYFVACRRPHKKGEIMNQLTISPFFLEGFLMVNRCRILQQQLNHLL